MTPKAIGTKRMILSMTWKTNHLPGFMPTFTGKKAILETLDIGIEEQANNLHTYHCRMNGPNW